jgi:serine/threonine protein kinase
MSELQDWFEYLKSFCTQLNLKSFYNIGNLLGKGNFAKVYEATCIQTQQKFALKTIEKKTLAKSKRNFVSWDTLMSLVDQSSLNGDFS